VSRNSIFETIAFLKEHWSKPKEVVHRGERCLVPLVCSLAPRGVDAPTFHRLPIVVPDGIREFWRVTKTAALFKDEKYGQWGVEVLDPESALIKTQEQLRNRPRDFSSADLVVARFFGDSDLVVVNCDPAQADFGSVTIALPIDRRPDWPVVAKSFTGFLESMIGAEGDKYWEVQS